MYKIEYLANIIKRKGLSQPDRLINALEPAYFMVDERTIDDFIQFITKFTELITYYNTKNIPSGNWETFFSNNLTVILIRIYSYNTEKLKSDFDRLLQETINADKKQDIRSKSIDLLKFVGKIFHELDTWFYKTEVNKEFQDELFHLIRGKLQKYYADLKYLAKLSSTTETEFKFLPESINLWGTPDNNSENSISYGEDFQSLRKRIFQLKDLFFEVNHYLEIIKASAKNHLDAHFKTNGIIEPHIGLLLTFIDLYRYPQKELNKFTERHLNHYYQDILKETPNNAIASKVHLFYTLAPKADFAEVKAGTLYEAGADDNGNKIIYKSIRDLVATQATIDGLKAVVNCTNGVDKIKPNELVADSYLINQSTYNNERVNGENLENYRATNNKELGLAISTELFNLDEGYRKVSLIFHVQKQSLWDFIENIEALNHKLKIETGLNESIKQLFKVEYSSNEGWTKVSDSNVECTIPTDEKEDYKSIVRVNFLLEPEDQAMETPTECEYGAFNNGIIKLLLNPWYSHLYNIFNVIEILSLEIDTEVLGVKNLILQNDFGLLDSNVPIQPFGALPKVGSNFYIGHKNLFNNYLTDLCISFEWMDLPDNDNGFEEFYNGYNYIDSNEIFKANLSILSNKQWLPYDKQQSITLFEDVDIEGDEAPINNHRRIDNINMANIEIKKKIKPNKNISYNNQTLNGFIKLELCSPANAFGHKEYPEILKQAINKNLQAKQPELMPNQPYTPVLKDCSVDYFASHFINLKKRLLKADQITSISPHGYINRNTYKPNKFRFFPEFNNETELYLGFNNLNTPGTISVYFHINELAVPYIEGTNKVNWYYLHQNTWINITPDSILYDTTNNLIQSGVILFDFHNKIETDNNTVLPNDKIWLKCVSNIGVSLLNCINHVRTQVTVAQLSNTRLGTSVIEANSIAGPIKNKKIATIEQPYPSFGGKNIELEHEYRKRVSETLRHKNRASSVWDIEHLILEKFPELYKVKCFNNFNAQLQFQPGNAVVVAIPIININNRGILSEPRLSYSKIVEIKHFIEQKASTFATYTVQNPNYEQIKVKANVKFKAGIDEGYFKKVLNNDINKLLSPWLFDDKLKPDFENVIHGSVVLNHLQNLDYIDFIENFALFHIVNDTILNQGYNSNTDIIIKPSTPLSILVSANEHYIDLVDSSIPDGTGINDMIVESDFMIEKNMGSDYLKDSGVEISSLGFNFTVGGNTELKLNDKDYIIDLKSNNNGKN